MTVLTRRDFVRTTLAATAVGAAGGWFLPERALGLEAQESSAAAVVAPRPFTAYTANSYFKCRVNGAPVDQARTAAFRAFMKAHPDQRRYPYPRISGTGSNRWGTAFAMGTSADPVWKLTGRMNPACKILTTQGFHAPLWLGAMLTGTSDSPFCVIDVASGYTVFAGNARVTGARTIDVSSAGVTYHASNGLHAKNPYSDEPRNFSSRGRISDAMVIRKDLIDYGVANRTDLGHVLHLFLAETRTTDGFCHPMVGRENGKNGFGAEGERIAIAPNVDVTRRGLSPEALVIARTLQNYGCYIGDNAGSDSRLKAEQENSVRPVWGGRLTMDSLAGLTWDDFVVLPRGWHGGR
jgi:hypothetical protein